MYTRVALKIKEWISLSILLLTGTHHGITGRDEPQLDLDFKKRENPAEGISPLDVSPELLEYRNRAETSVMPIDQLRNQSQ